MICPTCNVEMEKGIIQQGINWFTLDSFNAKFIGVGSKFLRFGTPWVYAWCCPKCKIITLQRE